MAMESVLMKHLCIVSLVCWLSVFHEKADGHVVPQSSQLRMKTDNDKIGNGSSSGATIGHGQASVCKDGFIQLVSKKCYFFSSFLKKWHDALAICESIGSTLAYPMNVIEDSVLVNSLRTHFQGMYGWYLGGYDEAKKNEWVWAHNKARINYTNWYDSGRSYNYGQCLHYGYDAWLWKDVSCTEKYPFVCQQLNDT